MGWRGMDWTDMVQDRGQVAGTCVRGNETSGSIKRRKSLDLLRTC